MNNQFGRFSWKKQFQIIYENQNPKVNKAIKDGFERVKGCETIRYFHFQTIY
tara:strand:+ start:5728 stop:5883 length:156 start_codon:yes stop_codon:yes gene_type:complete